MTFSVAYTSRIGGRDLNEDRSAYCYTSQSVLLLVADGLGGYPLGEVASQMAVDCMVACFRRHAIPRLADSKAFLTRAFLTAHYEILRYAVVRSMAAPPRTTLVAALVQDGQVQWAHCGDSRLYWVRDDAVRARTVDHAGPDRRHTGQVDVPQRHVLYTCVGAPTLPRIDVSEPAALEPGDKLLLCSDGLWGPLSDMEIARGIAHLPPHAATETLVQRAYRKAGARSDNLTALALEWQPAQKSIDDAQTGLDDASGWVCEPAHSDTPEPPTDMDENELIAAITALRGTFGPPVGRIPAALPE